MIAKISMLHSIIHVFIISKSVSLTNYSSVLQSMGRNPITPEIFVGSQYAHSFDKETFKLLFTASQLDVQH